VSSNGPSEEPDSGKALADVASAGGAKTSRSARPVNSGSATLADVRSLPLRLAAVALAAVVASCTVGKGEGWVHGSLSVPGCGSEELGSYDMNPDFFGGLAAQRQLTIRIQQGGDFQEYADSVTIAIQDIEEVFRRIEAGGGSAAIPVELQRPPGSAPNVPPPLARLTLSLRGTCGSHKLNVGDDPNVVLHGTSGTITFTSILHGDLGSRDTNSKRIEGTFDVVVEDPRGWGTTPAKGTLQGGFKFFYQRGGPAQPFP
jgi:hypothetical protein